MEIVYCRMRRKGRAGFTLAEVLVSVAIVTVLLAVVVPGVTQQVQRGELSRVITDAQSLRAGVEAFVNDVRRYPAQQTQLSDTIQTGAVDLNGNTIANPLVVRWRGPYIQRSVDATNGSPTAFDATIGNAFVLRNENQTGGPATQNYLALRISGIPAPRCSDINDEIDGTTGTPAAEDRGQIHCTTEAAVSVLYFLIVPIQ